MESMMKSTVYYAAVDNEEAIESVAVKLARLCQASGLFERVQARQSVAVKLHFGEEGNSGFVRPQLLAVICDQVRQRLARPVLADTNTLYRGRRTNSADHLKLAYEHGFTPEATGAEVIIPDDSRKEYTQDVELNGTYVKTAHLARLFLDADVLIGVAHFKGHLMTGFGGAMKNLGMGCATREGKLAQHSDMAPFVNAKKCSGCSACTGVCPAAAIFLKEKTAVIDKNKCIGCASCIAACPGDALNIRWEQGGNLIQEKMVEYAKAVLLNKQERAFFINVCLKITKECDCMAKDDPRIIPDIGVFASQDPLALDKACYDRVSAVAGRDILRELHPNRDPNKQFRHAVKLKLGNLVYDLVEV